MLEEAGLPEELVYAVKCHNDYHGLERKSLLDKALYATDPLTGLDRGSCFNQTGKETGTSGRDFLVNRFHEKSFARGARREVIASCSEMGLTLEEFMEIGLKGYERSSSGTGLVR